MKTCLVCQSDADRVELQRLPVQREGSPFGDFLICKGCFELLGADEVKRLIAEAVRERSYDASQFIAAEGEAAPEDETPLPRELEFTVAQAVLRDAAAFAGTLGEHLAPLLLARYRRGLSRVNLLTACAADADGNFHLQVVAEDV